MNDEQKIFRLERRILRLESERDSWRSLCAAAEAAAVDLRIKLGRERALGGDDNYTDGYRAAWREVLDQAAERLGAAACSTTWEVEKQEIEAEVRGLWISFIHEGNVDVDDKTSLAYPEGEPLAEVLRRFHQLI